MSGRKLRTLYQVRRTMVALKRRDEELSIQVKRSIILNGSVSSGNLIATIGKQKQAYFSEKKILNLGGPALVKKLTSFRKYEQVFIMNNNNLK